MKLPREVLDSKGTSAIGVIVALLGFSGIEVDVEEAAHLAAFISSNADSLAFIALSILGFIGRDPGKEPEAVPSINPDHPTNREA